MPTPRVTRHSVLPLALIAGLAMLAITFTLRAEPAGAQVLPLAAPGDGTVIYGGSVSGSNAAALTVDVGQDKDYIVSAVVPGGGNFFGAVVIITYDPAKATASCTEATNPTPDISVVCNDSFEANKIKISFGGGTTQGQDFIGMTGTNQLATITFHGVAAGVAVAASGAATVEGSCINGAGDTITCSTDFKSLTVSDGGGLVGDITCDGNVNIFDVTRLSGIILSRPGAVPGPCSPRLDLTCDGNTNIFDVTRLAGVILNRPGATIPATCPT